MQKYLSFFVVFFSFLSLSAGWGADLCEDQTCSGHGECQEDGENEWCVCDEGYIADGMECILGCNGVTCSGHGSCSIVSGAEVCTCEAGFYASGLSCILNEASTVDTLAILNSTDCYNTGNCHYRLIFATGAYDFTPALSSLYDIIINVLDSENVWHNYRKTVAQCVAEGVCDNVDAQYIDFWFQHNVSGNQYVTAELLGNGDDAYDDMYHDVLIDYCYGVNCGTGGTCDGTSGYPVCSCEEGYVLRSGVCEEGWFEDENLAAAIVELLQYEGYDVETETDIDPEMLADIDYLALRGKNISSLVGIGLFPSLAVLDISNNNIRDLSPLADCSELTVLNMSGNPANDLNPLSTLPLVSLDISYSGVYNINPLVSITTLSELIFADKENGRHGIIRPENSTVSEWLLNQEFPGCNKFYFYGSSNSNTFGVGFIETGSNCLAHGSCVNGMCVCDEGYSYSLINNSCYIPNICDAESHLNQTSGICEDNKQYIYCGDEPGKKFSHNYLEWNGSEYAFPAGYTNSEPCKIGDGTCDGDNNHSICRWSCKINYTAVGNVCVPRAVREIPDSAYNQLILPNISRQDVAFEPIPGVPSFAPVLKAGIYYDAKKNLVDGWHFDLPRVELNTNDYGSIFPLYKWDHKKLYVYMPWGREEYSIEAEKKCFDSYETPVNCDISSDIDRIEITYYPAPGQNLFSYIVLEATMYAYFNLGIADDRWKITRYGEDGSVTEFARNYDENTSAPRPDAYDFMDYIPIVKHTTRDKKETSFYYEWASAAKKYTDSANVYSILRSATIVDPLKRVIKIESYDPELPDSEKQKFGLMGMPGSFFKVVYTPLEGYIDISVGKANSEDEITGSLKKVVTYSNINGFSMDAEIYKDEHLYRKDQYRIDNDLFVLESQAVLSINSVTFYSRIGLMTWDINLSGYTEKKLVGNDNPNNPEYIVKTVSGTFYQPLQEISSPEYSLFYSPLKTVTIYSHEEGGEEPVEKKMVKDYFTQWLQPVKRETCPYNSTLECSSNSPETITEEIRYNVSGSPIYFKNADGQVTVNIYNTTAEVNPDNYIVHFLSDPWNYSNAVNLNVNLSTPDFIRADNLHKTGTLACSSVYSLDTGSAGGTILNYYVAYGITPSSELCSSSENKRVTNYVWGKEALGKPYDLKTVTYPDGKTKTLTYDYEISDFFQVPDGLPFYFQPYLPNGKVWGETLTGSNSQNTLQTCYEYNNDYQLVAQGIGTPSNCDPKKGFSFDASGLLMTQDFSYDENLNHILENDYIYDNLGRKLVERNSAGVSTVYVYDSLDRVVFTFFGCSVDNFAFENRVYTPYNFDGDDSAGVTGTGVTFDYNSGEFPYARYINLNACEYYRKYKYDAMSNLTETYFFEYWGVNQNNQIFKNTSSPKIIKQETEYDMIGRAVKSCQFDVAQPSDKRCIETEHDIFGNIVKKSENGEERIITYDLRNRPLTVTVDGLQTEEYSYSNAAAGGYFGYDSIRNKYENIDPLTTYKDKWGRAAKSVDPFGNETETTYESDYSDNITSQTTTSSTIKTGETAWTYDDLGRKSTETRKQFIPGSESTTNVNHVTYWDYDNIGNVVSVESSDGTKQTYSYDTLNRALETVNYEYINSNWVEASSSENSYDANGRLFRTETTRNSQTITEDYGFDTFGRVTSVKTTDSSDPTDPEKRYRVKFYNTGGQVIWEADEESDGSHNDFNNLKIFDVEVGNQKYYTYNAFGDLEKTVYVMTDSGHGNNTAVPDPDTNPWLNDSKITTNFTYDIFGRITSRTNDRSGVTEYSYYQNNMAGSHCRNKLQSIQISPAPTDNDLNYTDSDSVAQTYTYTYDEKGDEASVEYKEAKANEKEEDYLMTVSFTRDNYGRIISKTSDGSVPVTQTFTYNSRNLLETATDAVGNAAATSVTRLYDSFGNPYSESVSADNVTKTVSRRMTDAKTYQFTYPDGKTLRKTATGNDLDLIEYGTTGNLAEIASYSRANGVLTAITKGQNLIETFSYNNWNMLNNHTVSNANADVYDMSYNYSRGWHLIEKADGIRNTSDKYSYDSYYRLKEVKYDFANNTAIRTDSFFQDGVHNIEQSTENGTTFAWGVDKLNRLREKKIGSNTEVAYEYDERNNMISEDRSGTTNDKTYIYDDLNRLIEVKDGSQNTIATYTYDAFNRRITKTVGTTIERYSYDDWNIVEISTNSNDYTNIIDSGTDRHIAIEVTANNTSTLYYFLTDERGNVTALTDESGNILERYRYRVYGDFEILDAQFTPKNCNNQTCYTTNLHNFLWGGSLYEPETNLYWMRNRYYHIDMHRFINQDPIGIWGDANNLGNGFAYVAGMVIEASDPSGLDTNIGATGNDGLSFGYYSSSSNSESASKLLSFVTLGTSAVGLGGEIAVSYVAAGTAIQSVALTFAQANVIASTLDLLSGIISTFFIPDLNSKAHLISVFGEESAEIIVSIGNQLAESVGAKGFHYKDKGDGTVELTAVGSDGKEVKKTINLEEEKLKRDLEQADKFEEEPTSKDIELKNIESSSIDTNNERGVDPDSGEDMFQRYLRAKILKKRLKVDDNSDQDKPLIVIEIDTPIGKTKMVVRNPYYKNIDPLKRLMKGKDPNSRTLIFNPFLPPESTEYRNTYEKMTQGGGIIMPNVDPYLW